MRKLKNEELGRVDAEEFRQLQKNPVVIVLDNVRSMNNVGSALRTADAFLLKESGYTIIAVEQADKSTKLHNFTPIHHQKYAFIFGNEVFGVEEEVVAMAHEVVEIPQFGTKHSLNISVSIGIVMWHALVKLD